MDIGVDLDAWVADGRLRRLLQLIEQMPRAARWREASRNDPEYVFTAAMKRIEAEQSDDYVEGDYHPPATEWSTLNEQIKHALVLLGVIAAKLGAEGMQSASHFPGPLDPVQELIDHADREQDKRLQDRAWEQLGFTSTTST